MDLIFKVRISGNEYFIKFYLLTILHGWEVKGSPKKIIEILIGKHNKEETIEKEEMFKKIILFFICRYNEECILKAGVLLKRTKINAPG